MGPKHGATVLLLVLVNFRLGCMARVGAPTGGPTPADVPSSTGALDVTQMGGTKDLTKALPEVFRKACDTPGGGKILIPKGEYTMGLVALKGPCKGPIQLEVQGTITAPADPGLLKDSWITFEAIDFFTLFGSGAFNGNGQKAWSMNNCQKSSNCATLPVSLRFDFLKHAVVRDVASIDSKYFHVNVLGCENMTFTNFKIQAPGDSPNTDGIHLGRSTDIKIENTVIATGDDCISVGDGTRNLHVTGVTCGPGHGISVGSLGKYPNEQPVSGIFVRNCTMRDTQNGVRIKTYASDIPVAVTDLVFEDITVQNVMNPIIVDQQYCPNKLCKQSGASKVKISNLKFKNIRGTSSAKEAVKLICSDSLPCEKVEVGDIDITHSGPQGAATFQCANVKPTLVGKLAPGACNSTPLTNKN